AEIQGLRPELPVTVATCLDSLTDAVVEHSRAGDLVLAMGAGDVPGLGSRLQQRQEPSAAVPLAA
ncbi:MAG: UDP-N-acetylmuramate--alanine ligase, partial [Vulcanococcus sp.]